jgi:hypothetical protein
MLHVDSTLALASMLIVRYNQYQRTNPVKQTTNNHVLTSHTVFKSQHKQEQLCTITQIKRVPYEVGTK